MRTLEVGFDASGAAEAGRRGRVVAVVDVVDAATSAEAGIALGAVDVLGAAPAGASTPVPVSPEAIGTRAASVARQRETDVIVAAEPRVGSEQERAGRVRPVIAALDAAGVGYKVVANQGAELAGLASLAGRVLVVVSTTGGAALDAALGAGSPGACF